MLKVDTECLQSQVNVMNMLGAKLDEISCNVSYVNQNLRWNTEVSVAVRATLNLQIQKISGLVEKTNELALELNNVAEAYKQAEKQSKFCVSGCIAIANIIPGALVLLTTQKPTTKPATPKGDWSDTLRDASETAFTTLDVIMDQGKVSNGYVSVAKNKVTRFKNNLTNKGSATNLKNTVKDTAKDYTGANGKGKAAASWGALLVNGGLNLYDNLQEQKASNGEMSGVRVAAESVTETAVDVAVNAGVEMLVGAAITTATGAAAPAVAVVLVTTVVIGAADSLVTELTGDGISEHVSDFILDTGENLEKGFNTAKKKLRSMVGGAAKSAGKTVGGWFQKIPFGN